jgi:peptidoglycan/xylan/chitin deacetylase (PgdA/CDA1 family)
MRNLLAVLSVAVLMASCGSNDNTKASNSNSETKVASKADTSTSPGSSESPAGPIADAATILARPQVPVLCYHHIKDGKPTNDYTVNAETFRQQMKILADSGYHSVLPDQLYDYLAYGKALPPKPFMITYDDTDEEQFTIGKTEMDKHGFKGVYFIMTISIGKPRYMTKEQIKQLSDEGNVVASHTWRHDRVDKYLTTPHIDRDTKKIVNNDWDLQLVDTRKKLEDIIGGKEIHYFAYPFGIWKHDGIPEIQKRGIKMAFQLSDKRDQEYPLYTVRRVIVAPTWSPEGTLRVMRSAFK